MILIDDFVLKLLYIITTFYMNPNKFVHNTTFSVQLLYIAGHFL